MSANGLKRLRALEGEKAKLKRMYADMAQETAALKDLIEKSSEATRTKGLCRLSGGRAWTEQSESLLRCGLVLIFE